MFFTGLGGERVGGVRYDLMRVQPNARGACGPPLTTRRVPCGILLLLRQPPRFFLPDAPLLGGGVGAWTCTYNRGRHNVSGERYSEGGGEVGRGTPFPICEISPLTHTLHIPIKNWANLIVVIATPRGPCHAANAIFFLRPQPPSPCPPVSPCLFPCLLTLSLKDAVGRLPALDSWIAPWATFALLRSRERQRRRRLKQLMQPALTASATPMQALALLPAPATPCTASPCVCCSPWSTQRALSSRPLAG